LEGSGRVAVWNARSIRCTCHVRVNPDDEYVVIEWYTKNEIYADGAAAGFESTNNINGVVRSHFELSDNTVTFEVRMKIGEDLCIGQFYGEPQGDGSLLLTPNWQDEAAAKAWTLKFIEYDFSK
jgi:hypothetical protein